MQRLAKPNDYVVCILSQKGALTFKVVQVGWVCILGSSNWNGCFQKFIIYLEACILSQMGALMFVGVVGRLGAGCRGG